MTVNLTFSGTAEQGTDYTASDTKITIPAGKTYGTIRLTGLPVDLYTNGKTIIVTIDSVTNADKTTDAAGQEVTATIEDDNPPPYGTLSIDNDTIDANGGVATITCTLDQAIGADASIVFEAGQDSTAKATDYTISNPDLTLTIPAGQTTGTLTVTANQRTDYTPDLTLVLNAVDGTNVQPASGTPQSFTITIHDDPQRNKAAGEAFLADNATKPGVTVTDSGLQYKVIEEGSGPKPTASDTVSVIYTGTLIDGTQFDSSNGQTVTFGVSGLIQGWIEALQLMPVGSHWTLYIPYDLAYGEAGSGAKIPPYSALIFDITLVSIQGQ